MAGERRVVVVAVPGVQLLDVSGPLDVFAEANRQAGTALYRLAVAATAPGPVESSSGARLIPDLRLGRDGVGGAVDTLLVAGAPHLPDALPRPALLAGLRAAAGAARRFGSVCTGAFLLAEAGLLDGRRATTHWAAAARLAARHPRVRVEADAIAVRDGPVRTAAGVTAGLDLALALVEEDAGRALAMAVAAELVMYFRRPGGQKPFSRAGAPAPGGRAALQEVQRFVAAHPAERHDVAALAARCGLSPRHFARLFRAEMGRTVADWVEDARVAAARAMLEAGDAAPKQVAARCGFAGPDTLRRAFVRRVGVTPAAFRRGFARPGSPSEPVP